MAITKYVITNTYGNPDVGFKQAVQDYLVPDYFDSVENYGSYGLDCFDADDNLIVRFDWNWGSMAITATCYHSGGSNGTFTGGSSDSYLNYVWKCNNGIAFVFGTDGEAEDPETDTVIIFAKDKNGKTGVIAYTGIAANAEYFSSVFTDTGTIPAIETAWNNGTQTQLVKFVTHPVDGETNEFPKAFYMPVCQLRSIGYGKYYAGGKMYMTNGYYAIEDGDAT